MKKAIKIAALGVSAVVVLAGCATDQAYAEAPLAVTGEHLSYPQAHGIRDGLVEQYLAGADVQTELAAACLDLANLDGVYGTYKEQWILDCESPDKVWEPGTNTWVLAADAITYN